MVYNYYLIWKYNIPEERQPLVREHRLDIEIYKGKGVWEQTENFGGIFYGEVDADKISEEKAKSIIKLKDK